MTHFNSELASSLFVDPPMTCVLFTKGGTFYDGSVRRNKRLHSKVRPVWFLLMDVFNIWPDVILRRLLFVSTKARLNGTIVMLT